MDETARFVVVAAVPVAFTNVTFWSVVEPMTRRFVVVSAVVVPPPKENAPPVISPVLEMEKSDVVALAVDEAMEKSVVFVSPSLA